VKMRSSHIWWLTLVFQVFVLDFCRPEKTDYGLVVDAGSGGTRIYVFKWESFQEWSLKIDPIDSNYALALKPGISTSISTQKEMDDYLQPFLDFAESKIPSNRYATTPLFFRATAGLRMMTKDEAEGVLALVGTSFENSKFLFKRDSMKIISGIEEGLLNWLTINAIHFKLTASSHQTYGSLDLGLSSTQISFVPEDPDSIRSSLVSLHLFNKTHRLYDRSFLGFGINEAKKRMERILPQSDSGLIVNPCLPKSYSKKTPWKAVMDGTSNFTGCMQSTLALLKKEDCNYNCSIAGVFQPPLPRQIFNARDHYARVVNFLGLPFDASIFQINAKTKEVCALDYTSYIAKYSKEPEDYCFEACYVVTLLRDGFGFPVNNSGIHFLDHIQGIDTSWTLGAIYYEIGKFNYTLPSEDRRLVDGVLAAAAAIGFVVVVALVVLSRALSSQLKLKKTAKKKD